jgi:hypothetical protein
MGFYTIQIKHFRIQMGSIECQLKIIQYKCRIIEYICKTIEWKWKGSNIASFGMPWYTHHYIFLLTSSALFVNICLKNLIQSTKSCINFGIDCREDGQRTTYCIVLYWPLISLTSDWMKSTDTFITSLKHSKHQNKSFPP